MNTTSHRLAAALLASASLVTLAGCASSRSGNVYSRDQARQEMTVRLGVVESVREVQMEGTHSGAGTLAGGAIGGVAGSNIGGGNGQIVGAIVGAVAGAVAGNAIENRATGKTGLEITVRLDHGGMVAIVQEADEYFAAGQRVRVLSGRGQSRVTH
ncbi:glycine zipper 2TM domain-containing protein [Rhodocyclus tenuis]|uniref:Glycine zipper 2TM domain-containing protein n=2 Tax=Rhodocyclus TaxID=1064 RepID=A0A6L5JYU2_RHOTE|nr:glycine zipper 2TM domain-containing protein [Rhodocyclus gracilis]MQY52246.1 glycine zipper 2TM domain-containing protein [Rhodocyclus gracilis]MRD72324.1 glycine zipper 2TM domain-containing protein [Rhodocyclus gracilis]NJA89590.1 glycine zipper 2TM domain-containing protein [Rhodocyclus gracilis]